MVLKGEQSARWGKPLPGGPSRSYKALGWVGLGLLIVAVLEFGLTLLPVVSGGAEGRFDAVSIGFGSLPVLVIGSVFLVVAGFHTNRRWWVIVGGAVSLVMALAVLASAVVWASSVPEMVGTVAAEDQPEFARTVVQVAVESLVYPVVLGYLARMALRHGPAIPAR